MCPEDAQSAWVANSDDVDDDVYCPANVIDCASVCEGDAIEDCEGTCNGVSEIDVCGICGGDGPDEYCIDNDDDGLGSSDFPSSDYCTGDEPTGWVSNCLDIDDNDTCASNIFDV